MKRVEAERLYSKYTSLGATVEFKFDKKGGVEAVQIIGGPGPGAGWQLTVTDHSLTIHGELPLMMAEATIDYLLTGKGE